MLRIYLLWGNCVLAGQAFPRPPISLQFLSRNEQLTVIALQDFVPEMCFLIKSELSSILFLKSRHDVKWHFNQINTFPLEKKKLLIYVHFLCLSVTIAAMPWASSLCCPPLSVCFYPFHTLASTVLRSPSRLTWLSAHCSWFSTTYLTKA